MPLLDPVSAAWNNAARFDDYESAQRAVDRLSDDGFPVEKLDIVGSGLRLVERTDADRCGRMAGVDDCASSPRERGGQDGGYGTRCREPERSTSRRCV